MKQIEWSSEDCSFMKLAIALAEQGRGAVSPNPLVGCVIVKNGKKIGSGYHKGFGLPHAEKNALEDALLHENSLKGATLYVTLEPCSHDSPEKKTPPCVPYIVEVGISRVVISMADPNPLVSGRSIRMLKRAGIKVEVGCMESVALEMNRGFVTWISEKRPFVSMKVAASLDGKIATKSGDSKWITSIESRKLVYELRDLSDAILVGKGTVLADNPHLRGATTEPLRVVLDSSLKTSISAHVYESAKSLVFTTKKASSAKINQFRNSGINVEVLPEISIKRVLKELANRGVTSLFVEGGSQVFGSVFDCDCVDRIYWYIAPFIIGGREGLSSVSGEGISMVKNARRYKLTTCTRIGDDIFMILEKNPIQSGVQYS